MYSRQIVNNGYNLLVAVWVELAETMERMDTGMKNLTIVSSILVLINVKLY